MLLLLLIPTDAANAIPNADPTDNSNAVPYVLPTDNSKAVPNTDSY